ncbi:DUF1684 domain-containing protein [Curtobacterium flaccumfaciens]|uniref:DUF1684 domain-containing protein n=1 Tax=Curtobacterium flaccumfaciens TaxID=2035 RepID=UPI001266AD07|nr:DUF1684 domain-containing protein [Curtobacterium flaccumfaciens]MBT1665841.1 DUF1684 domain-containing protein [Curtobacterium flaccumfaciens pv. flaccumfaciens]QFS80461.1 DUF1684 domain-containing protein [Curtobacterium flaccumfaciens pv. flaccumfaciens]
MSTTTPTSDTTTTIPTTPAAPTFAGAWTAWHDDHEQDRASEHGFLAITSIRWLTATPERFEDAPGSWSTDEDGPVVALADDETIEVDGQPVTGTHRFGPLPERSSTNVVWRDGDETVVIEVARRGGSDLLRPRHPSNPTRVGYQGTPAYAPAERFVVDAHFEPFDTPREVTVGSVVDGLLHVYEAPGVLTFDLDGPRSLLAFNGHAGGLHVLFTDRTSGVTTYAANRSLDIAAPDADGATRIDFNRSTNLPCAYTPHATCPLPPAENRLDVAIEAGEQLPAA